MPRAIKEHKICLRCGRNNPVTTDRCLACGEKLKEPKVTAKTQKKQSRFTAVQVTTDQDNHPRWEERFDLDAIHCGDSFEIMAQMPDQSVDLVVTSPPYNFGLDDYDTHDDTRTWDTYFAKLNDVWQQCYRVLKPGGRLCVVVQPLFSDYIPTHHIISNQLRSLGYLFKAEIIWEKHNYNCKYTAWGSWKSPSMPYLKYTWEFIEVFCKSSQKKEGTRENADISSEEFKSWIVSKWDIAPESRMKEFGHPSMFPEEIPYRLIKLFSYAGDTVLDPFNGAGTTTLVARKLNRRYIGIDLSEKYCALARQRIKDYETQLGLNVTA